MPETVLLVSAHDALGLRVLGCLGPSGRSVYVASAVPRSVLRHSRWCRGLAHVDLRADGPGAVAAVARLGDLVRRHRVDVIVPSDVDASLFLAAARQSLTGAALFPLSEPAVIARLNDKWAFNQLLVEHGVPCPASMMLRTDEDVAAAARSWRFPAIVKPTDEEASQGVVRIGSGDDLLRYMASGARHARLPLLMQDFIPGADLDLSLLADNGSVLAWVVQSRADPASIAFLDRPDVLDVGRRIVAAVGYSGVVNIDMRVDERDGLPKPLEANPRFWATTHCSYWHGLDMPGLGIARALGRPSAGAVTLTGGRYVRHGDLVRRIARPWTLCEVSRRNWAGFRSSLADPVPQIAQQLRRWRERRHRG